MSKKTIFINNIDCTKLFTPYGYSVNYKKIHGGNGGTMLDGSTVEDVIAIKAVVTLPCMPLKERDFHRLLSSIYRKPYAALIYFDPRANDYRTIACIYNEISGTYRITNIHGQEVWTTGGALELTER